MNGRSKTTIAISLLVLSLILLGGTAALAGTAAGKVTNLNGPLFAERSDGSVRALARDSVVEVGDTLVTEKRTFARIVFADDSVVILRPGTRFKVTALHFDSAQPAADDLVLDAVKGGLRAITGQVGKRGNADAYQVRTPAATIGIRGTVYEVRVCADDCGGLAPGSYFFVLQGGINVTNAAGSVAVGPGEYAFARDRQTPPVLVPPPAGLDFALPADWSAGIEDWAGNPGHSRSCELR